MQNEYGVDRYEHHEEEPDKDYRFEDWGSCDERDGDGAFLT